MSGLERQTISVFLDDLGFFDTQLGGLTVHGANLSVSAMLRAFVAQAEVVEVFLPPSLMVRHELLKETAEVVLPEHRKGQGRLRFYGFHSVPEVWADGTPRCLFTIDPEQMATMRYLRDRFAVGPMPLICDTHALGYQRLWSSFSRLKNVRSVPYDVLTCVSTAYREAIDRYFQHTPPCRLEVVGRGVDTTLFHPVDVAEKQALRTRLGLPVEGTISLFLARVTPYDKADLVPLLDAFASVGGPTDYLLIAGRPFPEEYGTFLEAYWKEYFPNDNRLIVHGAVSVDDRPHYYAAADLYVLPGDTVQEALGNTVIEAMASGLPVVASDWDGFRDMVEEGVTGYLVPTYMTPVPERIAALSPLNPLLLEYLYVGQSVWVDTGALADRINRLVKNPGLRTTLGAYGRKRVEDHFTWPTILAQWGRIIGEMMELAQQEAPAARRERLITAESLALPTDYRTLFSHYGTGMIAPEQAMVRLSAVGEAVSAGRRPINFYDDVTPLLNPNAITGIVQELQAAGRGGILWGNLTQSIAAKTRIPLDDAGYHIALLLKRGYVELSPQGSFAEPVRPAGFVSGLPARRAKSPESGVG